MSEKLAVRQRLLVKLGNIAELLGEIGHLPGDRLLVIDVDMTKPEHTEWVRRAVGRGIADLNAPGGAFDHLADEPDLYSDADLKERNEGTLTAPGADPKID